MRFAIKDVLEEGSTLESIKRKQETLHEFYICRNNFVVSEDEETVFGILFENPKGLLHELERVQYIRMNKHAI